MIERTSIQGQTAAPRARTEGGIAPTVSAAVTHDSVQLGSDRPALTKRAMFLQAAMPPPPPRPPAPPPRPPHPPAPPHPPEPHPPDPHPPHPPDPHPPDPHPPHPPDPHPPDPHPPDPHPPHPPDPHPPGPDPNFSPLTVDAEPLQAADGSLTAVSEISISQVDDPSNAADQVFDDPPQTEAVTLDSAQAEEAYLVGVTWVDGSSYQNTVINPPGGTFLDVNTPTSPPQ